MSFRGAEGTWESPKIRGNAPPVCAPARNDSVSFAEVRK